MEEGARNEESTPAVPPVTETVSKTFSLHLSVNGTSGQGHVQNSSPAAGRDSMTNPPAAAPTDRRRRSFSSH